MKTERLWIARAGSVNQTSKERDSTVGKWSNWLRFEISGFYGVEEFGLVISDIDKSDMQTLIWEDKCLTLTCKNFENFDLKFFGLMASYRTTCSQKHMSSLVSAPSQATRVCLKLTLKFQPFGQYLANRLR